MKKIVLVLLACVSLAGISVAQDSTYYRAKIWDKTIGKFKDQDKAKFPSQKNLVLFIGSSSFTRWNNIQSYFPESNVINRGFGGSMTSDLIYYAEQIIFPYKPSQIVIYEGDNDVGSGMSVDAFVTDVKALVRFIEVRLPGVPVIILSVKSSPRRDKSRANYEAANVALYEYSFTKKHVTFLDVYSSLLDNQGNYRTELFAPDMLHVNEDAYKLWADVIRPHLIKKDGGN